MIRSELIARIAERHPHLFARDAEAAVGIFLDMVADALAQGDRVELRGFGVFNVRRQAARTRRDPRTQKAIEMAPSAAVQFKAAKAMQNRLNPTVQARQREPKHHLQVP